MRGNMNTLTQTHTLLTGLGWQGVRVSTDGVRISATGTDNSGNPLSASGSTPGDVAANATSEWSK